MQNLPLTIVQDIASYASSLLTHFQLCYKAIEGVLAV